MRDLNIAKSLINRSHHGNFEDAVAQAAKVRRGSDSDVVAVMAKMRRGSIGVQHCCVCEKVAYPNESVRLVCE